MLPSQHYHYLRWSNLHVRHSVMFYIILCLYRLSPCMRDWTVAVAHSGGARSRNLGGKLIFWGGGQDRIFKKVLLYRHRGTNILGISPPPPRGANAPGISPPPPFRIFASHICDVVYSNNFVIFSSY